MAATKSSREPVATTTTDPTAERIGQLKQVFPDIFADGKLDVKRLRAALGESVAGDGEHYTFSWAGRSDAVETLRMPSRATLQPMPGESVNPVTTKHLYIEGDNLEVLKLLYKPYAGQVKLIYIDPPYNTGQDFIYPDDFRDTLANYLRLTNQSDDEGNLLRSNPDTSGRYHSDWLSMMYPRLFLARQLLRDDGVIFVSIDDHEVYHLRMLMNEIFGEENFVVDLVWQKRISPDNDEDHITSTHENIICFTKDKSSDSIYGFQRSEEQDQRYENPDNDERGPWTSSDLTRREYREKDFYKIKLPSGREVEPASGRSWSIPKSTFEELIADNRLWFGPDGNAMPRRKRFLSEVSQKIVPVSWWTRELSSDNQTGKRNVKDLFPELNEIFENPKPCLLIKNMLKIATKINDLVLDFFSGSGTTAQAVLELNREDGGNRRFILVQLPEPTGNPQFPTIAEIGKERVRRVIAKMKAETGNMTRTEPEDLGFQVFKLTESHFNLWAGVPERTPEAYQRQMRLIAEDPLRPGWTAEGLLWEVAIKEGYGLNSVIEDVPNAAGKVYRVRDPEKNQSFRAFLGDRVPEMIAKELGLGKEDLFVVRDLALDDTLASNLALQCRLKVI